MVGQPRLLELCGPYPVVADDVPTVEDEVLAHVLGEPCHLHSATRPGNHGLGIAVAGLLQHIDQVADLAVEGREQVLLRERAKRRLALLEGPCVRNRPAGKMGVEDATELLGVACLVGDHVTDRPCRTSRPTFGWPCHHRLTERAPFGEELDRPRRQGDGWCGHGVAVPEEVAADTSPDGRSDRRVPGNCVSVHSPMRGAPG